MTTTKSIVLDQWTFDKVLLTGEIGGGTSADVGGLVLQNVRHQQYHLARDIRVVRVWVGSIDIPGPAVALQLGSRDLPLMGSEEIKLPMDTTGLIKPFNPPARFRSRFQTPGPVLGPGSQRLAIQQDYLFTEYGKNPPHEPGGLIDAARLYPLVSFSYPQQPNDKVRVDMIRVDLRMALALETLGTPGMIPILQFNNQSGVFHDSDKIPAGTTMDDAFVAAEKPVRWELLGRGIALHGEPTWDNIHQWPADTKLPLTPGAAHAAHLHWRWGAPATVGGFPAVKGGPQFEGLPRHPGEAETRPLLDPRIPDQTLEFAIAAYGEGVEDSPAAWAPAANSSTPNFGDLFTKARDAPTRIDNGSELVTWLSAIAFRIPAERSGLSSVGTWEGTFFAHGLFFAHQHEPALLKLARTFKDLGKPLFKASTNSAVWRRPK